ncbi:MAG: hypothetical protein ACON5A_03670 [Candidatus Comchoanobacterales bacterium]
MELFIALGIAFAGFLALKAVFSLYLYASAIYVTYLLIDAYSKHENPYIHMIETGLNHALVLFKAAITGITKILNAMPSFDLSTQPKEEKGSIKYDDRLPESSRNLVPHSTKDQPTPPQVDVIAVAENPYDSKETTLKFPVDQNPFAMSDLG